MKKIFATVLLTLLVSATASAQFNLGSILGGGSSDDNSSSLGGLGSVLGGVVDAITGSNDITVDDLVGTWTYTSPAVTFDSDNALQKVGGSAATGVIENKLAPYYQKVGLNNLVLTINADHTFTMKAKFGSISGVVEKTDEGLVFNFKAFKKVNLGKVKTMASKSLTGLTLTFDVSRLKTVVSKAATLSKNQTVQTLASLLGSYDGIYAGFRLNKSGN